MKYLTKPEVQLRHHKASEEETNVTSTEDKNWGVEENDVRDIYWIILCVVCGGAFKPHSCILTNNEAVSRSVDKHTTSVRKCPPQSRVYMYWLVYSCTVIPS